MYNYSNVIGRRIAPLRESVPRPPALLGIKSVLRLLDFLCSTLDPAYMENTPCLGGFGRLSRLGEIAATGFPCPLADIRSWKQKGVSWYEIEVCQ